MTDIKVQNINSIALIATYQLASFDSSDIKPDPTAFYDIAYRPVLRRMAAYIIAIEGPVFDDLIVRRIARAHGFARAAGKIRELVLGVVERKFPCTVEEGRKIYWPEKADTSEPTPFRSGSLNERDHIDIPMVELTSLAQRFLSQGADPAEASILMGRELGLGRLREATRARFEKAALASNNKETSNDPDLQ